MAAYAYMAKRENNPKKKAILNQMSADDQKHATLWQSYAHKDIKPKVITMFWLKFGIMMMGFTFVLKKMTKGKRNGQQIYYEMQKETPVAVISLGVATSRTLLAFQQRPCWASMSADLAAPFQGAAVLSS